jgi:hypothetical protein
MRAVVCKKISPKHTNIALLKGERIVSDEVIQIRDLSIQVQENQLPIFEEARIATVDYTGTLNITSDTLTPKITSEYNFVTQNAEYIPLFLKHDLQLRLYNNTAKERNFEIKTVVEDQEYQFVSQKEDTVIIPNTINVYNKSNYNQAIPTNRYVVDLGRKRIKFNNTGYEGDNFIVNFRTMTNNVDISDEYGNKLDPKFFRLNANKYETTPSLADPFTTSDTVYLNYLYTTSIFLANVLETDRTYFVSYPYFDKATNNSTIRKEAINPIDLYTKVDSFLPSHTVASFVFRVNETTYDIQTKLSEYYPRVFVKYPANRNSKLALLEPQQVPHENPWFIEVSNDKFVAGSYTYRPLERNSQNIINGDYTIFTSVESIAKISPTIIKTQYPNIVLRTDNEGDPSNIEICNGGFILNDIIEWVDTRRGLIKLKREIVIDESNNALKYEYKINNIQIKNPNINPYMIYNATNNNPIDKFILYYMLPEEELDARYSRSIFNIIVYQHPEWYENVPEYQESIAMALAYIYGTTDGISNLYNIINKYISSTAGNELHPIILGYVGVGNISTPDSIEFNDVRRRGGGLRTAENINDLLAEFERHYLDIAKIDGYDYNLSNAIIVKIKPSIKDALKILMSKYDPYAQRSLRDNPLFSIDEYVMSFIEFTVKKYVNAAANITIEYKE